MTNCKYCHTETTNDGTQLCDRCWELSNRIAMTPRALLAKILSAERTDLFVIQSDNPRYKRKEDQK